MMPEDRRISGRLAALAGALLLVVAPAGRAEGPRRAAQPTPTEALARSVTGNDHPAIRALIKAGADPNRGDADGESALHLAAADATPGTLRLLLALGARPELLDRDGQSALQHAVTASSLEKVRLLGPLTADPKVRLDALLACFPDDSEHTDERGRIIRYLVEELKADVNGADTDGMTPLMAAAGLQFHQTVRLLLQRGARVNALDRRGRTALFYSLASYPTIVVGDDERESALDLSSEFEQTLRLLLGAGADATIRSATGETALIAYLTGGNIQHTQRMAQSVLQSLLKAGAPLDARDKDGKSALEHVQHLQTLTGPSATISAGTARKLQRLLGRKRQDAARDQGR